MLSITPIQRIWMMSIAAFGAIISSTFPLSIILAQQDIAAAFSVTRDEITWMVTLYNLGQLFGLPITFLFSKIFGRRRTMLIAGIGFLFSSLIISFCSNFPIALFFRFWHGFYAGMLPVIMFIILFSTHPLGHIRTRGLSLFAFATAIGLGISAWLGSLFLFSENWKFLFIIPAVFIGFYIILADFLFIEDPIDLNEIRNFDWSGYTLVSLGLGSILIALSEGERYFWFETWWIPAFIIIGLIFLFLSVFHLLNANNPLFKLSLFSKPFSLVLIYQVIFRFGTLFAIWLTPFFLTTVLNYRIEQLALVLWPLAPGTLIGILIALCCSTFIDQRIMMSSALLLIACCSLYCVQADSTWSFENFTIVMFASGIGIGTYSLATLHMVLYELIPIEGPTCGMGYNYARIMGLSGGLGILSHFINEREKFHSAILTPNIQNDESVTAEVIKKIQNTLSPSFNDLSVLQNISTSKVATVVREQSYILAINDGFLFCAILLIITAALVWFCPKCKSQS